MNLPNGFTRVHTPVQESVILRHFEGELGSSKISSHGDGVFEMMNCDFGCRDWFREELLSLLSKATS